VPRNSIFNVVLQPIFLSIRQTALKKGRMEPRPEANFSNKEVHHAQDLVDPSAVQSGDQSEKSSSSLAEQCPACQKIADAMINWREGEYKPVKLGSWQGFLDRRQCECCQMVVEHMKNNVKAETMYNTMYEPSCPLAFFTTRWGISESGLQLHFSVTAVRIQRHLAFLWRWKLMFLIEFG
jgi:hypothetical protein